MNHPRIVRLRGVESARHAIGATAVIDVLRAFTTAAIALGRGADRIVLVATAAEAFALRSTIQGALLVGEVAGRPIPGFDHGNSPEEMDCADVTGRTIVLRSTSGVQAALRAVGASEIVLASLVTASATARHLARSSGTVTLIAAGSPGEDDAEEDEACADVIADLLLGRTPDFGLARRRVRASRAAERALDPAVDWITPGDLERALAIDRCDFTLLLRPEGGLLVARAAR